MGSCGVGWDRMGSKPGEGIPLSAEGSGRRSQGCIAGTVGIVKIEDPESRDGDSQIHTLQDITVARPSKLNRR